MPEQTSEQSSHLFAGRPARLIKAFFILLTAALCLAPASASGSAAGPVARVLMVDSYSSSDIWSTNLRQALIAAFSGEHGHPAGFETFEFCVRYQPGLAPAPGDVESLQAKIDGTGYDLIVVANNPAANLFLNGELRVPAGTPVLISAYNGSLEGKIPAAMELTGIENALNMQDNVLMGLRLLPQLRQINIIVESTSDGDAQVAEFGEWQRENATLLKGIEIHFLSSRDLTTRELLEAVAGLPQDSLLLFNSWCSDNESTTENIYTVLPRVRQLFPGLIMGRVSDYIPYGSAGGMVLSASRQGRQAGEMALRIIGGESAGSIPVQTGSKMPIFDYPSLLKYHVSLSNLPPGAELRNRPPGFWATYWDDILYIIGGLFLLWLGVTFPARTRRQAQKKTAAMFEHLPQYIFVVNRSGEVLYKHLSEGAASNLTNCNHMGELPEEIRDRFRAAVEEVFSTGEKLEFQYDVNGRNRRAEFILLPPSNPFRQKAVMWISTDQTELFRAHADMAQLAERFHLMLNSIGDGVIATDVAENITLINPVAAKLIGIDQREAVGLPLKELFRIVSYIDGSTVPSPLTTAIAEKRIVELANHTDLIARDGTRRHIADSAAPLHAADGETIGGILVFRDVTDEYNKRDELRRNNATLDSISKVVHFVHFRHDGRDMITDDSDGLLADFWLYENGSPVPPERWVSPDDLPEFEAAQQKLFGGETDELDIVFSAGAGKKRYFSMRMILTVNAINGKREYCGVLQEITRSREQELRHADELKLLEVIINNLPGHIFVKNADKGLTYEMCNRAFADIIGVRPGEIVGKSDSELLAHDREFHAWFEESDRKLLETGNAVDGQGVFTNSQGRTFALQVVKNIVKRSDGARLLIGMGMDISHQYQLEQERKRSIECEKLINSLLSMVLQDPHFEKMIPEVVRLLGTGIGCGNAYIVFEDRASGTRTVHRWVRGGIDPAPVERLAEMDSLNGCCEGEYLLVNDAASPAPRLSAHDQTLLAECGVKSVLNCAISDNGRYGGFLGCADFGGGKRFDDADLHALRSAVMVLSLGRDRFRQTGEIENQASFQAQLMENISIPLVILDLEGRVAGANRSLCKMTGSMPQNAIGRPCHELLCRNAEMPPLQCPRLQCIRLKGLFQAEMTLHDRQFIVSAHPIFDRAGRMTNILQSFFDITDLTRQQIELRRAMEQAQAADRAKSYFLATVSHELRTPLNAVIGFSELLQDGDVRQEEAQEYLQSINFAGNALLNLINDVLDLSKLEADQVNIVPVSTDMHSLLGELSSIFRLKAKEKNLTVKMTSHKLDSPLLIDTLRMRQVLLNLVGNAIKFTNEGSVEIDANFRPNPGTNAGTLTIRVTDTGLGISPEKLQQVFDPFVQDDSTKGNKTYEGSGLGLAISQRLVRKMGGEITLESTPGKGSIFTVRIDNVQTAEAIHKGSLKATPAISAAAANQHRVLLVDDVPLNLRVLKVMLNRLGIETQQAASGAEALMILLEDQDFIAVFTDLWMPGMNGIELAKNINSTPGISQVPIFAITADTQQGIHTAPEFQGALFKPVTLQALRELLEKKLKIRFDAAP